MAEIRALIVDDEPLARRGVRQLLEPHGDVRVVGEAATGAEAVTLIHTLRPDLLFLDVQMPGMDGFGVLNRAALGAVPAVIFITAYDDFAVRAFDVEATDYLVKPITRGRFDAAVRRARERLARARAGADAAAAEDALAGSLLVQSRQGDYLLRPEEIDWVEAADYYAAVHAGGRRFLVRTSLAALERRLPEGMFLRVHRSALVNLARVRRIVDAGDGGTALLLSTGHELPVSRRNRAALQAWLRRHRA